MAKLVVVHAMKMSSSSVITTSTSRVGLRHQHRILECYQSARAEQGWRRYEAVEQSSYDGTTKLVRICFWIVSRSKRRPMRVSIIKFFKGKNSSLSEETQPI